MRAKMSRPRRCRERVDGHRGPGNVHHCSRYARPCAAVSLGLSHSPLGRCCCGCGEGVPPGKVRRRASTLRRFEAEAPTLARLLAKEHHGAQVAALQPRGALAAPAVGSNGGSALGHGQRPRPRSAPSATVTGNGSQVLHTARSRPTYFLAFGGKGLGGQERKS